jgi:hypothetical protein
VGKVPIHGDSGTQKWGCAREIRIAATRVRDDARWYQARCWAVAWHLTARCAFVPVIPRLKDDLRYNKKAGVRPAFLTHVLHSRTLSAYQNSFSLHVTNCGDTEPTRSARVFRLTFSANSALLRGAKIQPERQALAFLLRPAFFSAPRRNDHPHDWRRESDAKNMVRESATGWTFRAAEGAATAVVWLASVEASSVTGSDLAEDDLRCRTSHRLSSRHQRQSSYSPGRRL